MLAQSFGDHRVVWLDAKKSREELRPARIVHRCHEQLAGLAESKGLLATDFSKDLRFRTISCKGQVWARIVRCEVTWTSAAAAGAMSEELDMVKSCAEEE